MDDLAAGQVRATAGPRSSAAGIGTMKHIGGGAYEQTFDPAGPQADCWVYEDLVYINKRHVAAVGFDRDDMTMSPITYDEMRPGCYDPKARLADMEMNWVEASLVLPDLPALLRSDVPRSQGPRARGSVRARVQRLDGRGVVRRLRRSADPVDHRPAVGRRARGGRGAQRNAARGVHAVCFSEIPPKLGLPSIHSGDWDPFFTACQETDTVVCMHIGSSSQMPATSPDAPVAVAATLSFNNAMASLSDLLFSGVLVRFPTLKLAYSEGQIGWLPYVLERADDVWRDHRAWGGVKELVPEPPSTYYYDHVFGCFFSDRHGLESLDRVGVDNITFETDYPHTDSTWPDTKKIAEDMVRACPTTRSTRSCAATRSACCRSTST